MSDKTTYSIQVIIILAVFFFVLFNLVFKLVIDMRTQALEKKVQEAQKEQIKQEFITKIDVQYDQLKKLYDAGEYDKAIEIIKIFNKFDKSDYKDLPEMKKAIRLFYLKKKMDFIPRIDLGEYMQLTKDIDIEEDDSTEVFIRTPRYGQYFYASDLPVVLEGVALSIAGDFSEQIIWTSSIDGELGKGKKIEVNLSIGAHEIIAQSTNGVTTGTMSVRIYIEKDPDFLKEYKRD
ncbi:MAG: hypothetical protein KKE62_13490 [Proteobacteria bacterium]|nr:hypothetical protein [Pseudomonadota bacterium]MBU1389835.1 hypothetical protein [Pseudomonadota bacterium]MBU1543844.1 hypothetical protein [Pseudomonadota bacterium]MBU2429451.1 hypothetical protein [Pseudomonadota bacterium]MBU2481127.1 hypothetical protein [Pseudomonadota bacterium]